MQARQSAPADTFKGTNIILIAIAMSQILGSPTCQLLILVFQRQFYYPPTTVEGWQNR